MRYKCSNSRNTKIYDRETAEAAAVDFVRDFLIGASQPELEYLAFITVEICPNVTTQVIRLCEDGRAIPCGSWFHIDTQRT